MMPLSSVTRLARVAFRSRSAAVLVAFAVSFLALSGCGGKEPEPQPTHEESTLPVQGTVLRLAVQEAPGAVELAASAWARKEAVGLELVVPSSPGAAEASLVESQGPGDELWLLEPRGLLVRLDALEELGRDARPPRDWVELSSLVSELGHKGGGLGLAAESEGLHELLLPLIWSAQPDSVCTGPSPVLQSEEAEEALAFLVQLAQQALRLPAAERDGAFLSGQVGILPCGLEQARRLQASMPDLRLALWPWPAAPDRGGPRALAVMHSLRVPRGAPHADLARELARELAGADAATAVAIASKSCIPASAEASFDLALLPSQTRQAMRPWPQSEAEAQEAALLDDACDAALDLRRSPAAALDEARKRAMAR